MAGLALAATPLLHAQMSSLDREETPVLYELMPSIERFVLAAVRYDVARRGTIVALAIEAYRARFGELPSTLDQLVERGVLDELPDDIAVPDGAWVYKQTAGTPGYVP